LIALVILPGVLLIAQDPRNPQPEASDAIGIDHIHRAWPSPEALTGDLRSPDDQVRLKALQILGVSDQDSHETDFGPSGKPTGSHVAVPEQVLLRYAAIGRDATSAAILAVSLKHGFILAGAVAIPIGKGWQRIASFACGCKYEQGDRFRNFIELTPAPVFNSLEHYELVIRASGGGSGVYEQDEAHYRILGSDLRRVIHFESRYGMCDPTGPEPHWCIIRRAWFTPMSIGDKPVGVLVRAEGRFPGDHTPGIYFELPDLQIRHLKELACTAYLWNEDAFRYEPSSLKPQACEDK